MRLFFIAGHIFMIVGLLPGLLQAASGGADKVMVEPVPGESVEVASLWVEVFEGPAQLEPAAIRSAIEKELGLRTLANPDRPYVGKVSVEGVAGPAVIVRYESKDATTRLERRVALPVDPERRSLVISWVVGNLVRNEAAEILSGMLRRKAELVPDPGGIDSGTPHDKEANPAISEPAPVKAEQSATPPALTPPTQPALEKTRLIHLALFSPGIALHADAHQHRYQLSFGGVYSQIGALDGFGLTWLVDSIDQSAKGAQIAGIWAQAGSLCPAPRTGKLCLDGQALLGVQLGGLVSYIGGGFRGAQIAGIAAVATDRVEGLQLSGGIALTRAELQGVQAGMVGNLGRGQLRGVQLSGLFNYQDGNLAGLQLTGGVNLAEDLGGMQLGLVNVARDVDGLQLGIVNLARENRGLALGLFNWSKGARLQPTYFFQTPAVQNVGFKTISGHSTSSVSFGYDAARDIARTHFAFGVRSTLDRFAIGLESGYGWVLERFSTGPSDRAHEVDLVGTVTLEIVRNMLSVYGGGGVAMPVSGVVPIEPHGLAQAGISFL